MGRSRDAQLSGLRLRRRRAGWPLHSRDRSNPHLEQRPGVSCLGESCSCRRLFNASRTETTAQIKRPRRVFTIARYST
jgi:hypothetical protein